LIRVKTLRALVGLGSKNSPAAEKTAQLIPGRCLSWKW
jgi:hypothetical protein